MVDWNWPRRHADLGHSFAVAAVMAQFDQPLCRSDDAFRRRLRRSVSAYPRWTSVAGVLAGALSQHHEGVAAISQSPGVGRVCGLNLRHDFAALLVHRPYS